MSASTVTQSADATVVVVAGGIPWRGSFAQFILNNKAVLTLREIQMICDVLDLGGTYNGTAALGIKYTIQLEDRS